MNVAVLGASNKPERYSHQAVKLLAARGHTVFPVNPALHDIDGIKAYPGLSVITQPINTITVYLGAARSSALTQELLTARPRRVIFNPGAENPGLAGQLREAGVEILEACTLVLLKTEQFDTP
ncbi:MAG: CoA-binding protein [Kiritimatiellia bacterium]